jgi:hypothetical protein
LDKQQQQKRLQQQQQQQQLLQQQQQQQQPAPQLTSASNSTGSQGVTPATAATTAAAPSGYEDVAEAAFGRLGRVLVSGLMYAELLGICCVYVVLEVRVTLRNMSSSDQQHPFSPSPTHSHMDWMVDGLAGCTFCVDKVIYMVTKMLCGQCPYAVCMWCWR